ncbi:MAG: hypothetical protein HRT90_00390 [Candidatus Margulisbacteria bacterium]|nr:hypothetical protein [Candidatus Margulisiibacteriota bacterium]
MSTTTFSFDKKTDQSIETLKKDFHLKTKSEVIRKALALLYLARTMKGEDDLITIGDGKNQKKTVFLR